MSYIMTLCCWGFIGGMISMASNPTPYFAALGLVVAATFSCGILAGAGGVFLSLIVLLIYLGGMLVVFAYSVALAAEAYPESWGTWGVLFLGLGYAGGTGLFAWWTRGWWNKFMSLPAEGVGEMHVDRVDSIGVSLMYESGGGLLIIGGAVLLLVLFVVLELTRGRARGTLRAV